jgi:multimeric flavodoxin WrbA
MKVTAFVGSARKKHTYYATEKFLQKLQSLGDIEYEIVSLSDCDLKTCKGCIQCFNKGEEFCPLKDDRDKLIEKMNNSDGIIFSSPNYSFNVSGLMKVFLDRLGFIFHRPCFFGKACTSIVVQGFYGGNKIIDYFNFIGKGLGFNVVNGISLNSLEPMTEKEQKKTDRILEKQSKKFYSTLILKEYPNPTLFHLMIFRMARTRILLMLDDSKRDYTYYNQNGWFGSLYYYPVKLNQFKKLAGRFFDFCFNRMFGKGFTGKQRQPSQNCRSTINEVNIFKRI